MIAILEDPHGLTNLSLRPALRPEHIAITFVLMESRALFVIMHQVGINHSREGAFYMYKSATNSATKSQFVIPNMKI
jgi:hypothetical protein